MGIAEYLEDRLASYKSRTDPYTTYTSSGRRFISGSPVSIYSGTCCSGYGEETMSLYHQQWHGRKGIARDIGGPFFNRKVRVTTDFPLDLQLQSGNTTSGYIHSGFLAPLPVIKEMRRIQLRTLKSGDLWTSDSALSRSALRALGLNLLLKASPTTPAFAMANSLGELISEKSLFSFPNRGTPTPQSLSGDYLNLQFGILPVISDEKKFIEAHQKSEEIIKQFLRDSGRKVNRRRAEQTVVTATTTTYTTGGEVQLLAANGSPNGTPLATALGQATKLTVTKRITRDVWFSGQWRYYVPKQAEHWIDTLVERNRVYGFVPTPLTAWELTPFSWLVDWFVNTDDLIRLTFMAGTDGSVPVRSYVMAKTIISTEYTWTGNLRVAGSWKPHIFTWTVDETIQQRENARAFGIGWKTEGLTPRQLSILTALGISSRK